MIRTATPADIPLLVAMTESTGFFKPLEIATLREVLEDYFAEQQGHGHRCICAEREGQVHGFAYFAPAAMTEGTWELWWIVVRPDLQARGLGTVLLRHVEDTVRAGGARALFIDTSSQSRYEPTRRFYMKNGYEQHAVLEDFYAPGDSKVIFRKSFSR